VEAQLKAVAVWLRFCFGQASADAAVAVGFALLPAVGRV